MNIYQLVSNSVNDNHRQTAKNSNPIYILAIFSVSSVCTYSTYISRSYNFKPNFLTNSMPSARVPTRASIAYPSASSLFVSSNSDASGTEKHSINSLSSSCGCGFWFSRRDMSTRTWTMWRFVLQKPGSVDKTITKKKKDCVS